MASRISSSEKGVRAAAGGAAAGAHVRGDERAAHVAELPSHDCNRGPVAGVEALGAPILAAAAGPGRVPVEDGRRRAVLLAPALIAAMISARVNRLAAGAGKCNEQARCAASRESSSSPASLTPGSRDELAADDHPLDLAGAFADQQQ